MSNSICLKAEEKYMVMYILHTKTGGGSVVSMVNSSLFHVNCAHQTLSISPVVRRSKCDPGIEDSVCSIVVSWPANKGS